MSIFVVEALRECKIFVALMRAVDMTVVFCAVQEGFSFCDTISNLTMDICIYATLWLVCFI